MVIPKTQLQKREQMMFRLRSMYADYGYTQFRIRKFEEYELYVRNKDFLNDVNIISFTDTNGKLMALKPDVTLSVVKNSRDIPGTVQKVYYNENIYRVSRRSHVFEELMQVGIECIGDVDTYNICEVLALGAKTLKEISEDAVLVVSDLDIVSSLLEYYHVPEDVQEDILACLGEKNVHTLRRICSESEVDPACSAMLARLSETYGRPEKVLKELEAMTEEVAAASGRDEDGRDISGIIKARIEEIRSILETIGDESIIDIIRLDFSVVSDVNYYNGIVFNGFVEGLPECVISGGQYDRLMKKMKRTSRAIGFGVYMDRLEHYLADDSEYDIDVLLLYDDDSRPADLRKAVEKLIEEGNTVLAQRRRPEKLKYRKMMKLEDGEVKEVE